MKNLTIMMAVIFVLSIFWGCTKQNAMSSNTFLKDSIETKSSEEKKFEVTKTEEEWKSQLSPMQYEVTRNKATERAFSNEYYNNHEEGKYVCVGCGLELFTSDTKYDSGCGWPSFFAPSDQDNILVEKDFSHGLIRDEVVCSRCGAHLGHVFDDGPKQTGLRYCINSASLKFNSEKK